ncbi:hypothetical protein clem_07840 [Legionella clemsonensis]|uniref:Uncharacterized protein n=1 Tax=Legionella clemsonensis TaxID=1867846 RepID=A0A222P2S0_9GAMM|nr:hypothetical protein clem_07840 [Legionella clemsonensis]
MKSTSALKIHDHFSPLASAIETIVEARISPNRALSALAFVMLRQDE